MLSTGPGSSQESKERKDKNKDKDKVEKYRLRNMCTTIKNPAKNIYQNGKRLRFRACKDKNINIVPGRPCGRGTATTFNVQCFKTNTEINIFEGKRWIGEKKIAAGDMIGGG